MIPFARLQDGEILGLAGAALHWHGDLDAALACCRLALAYNPAHSNVHTVLGNTLARLGRHASASAHWRHAAVLEPGQPGYRFNLALAQLADGDFPNGWRNYEARLQRPESMVPDVAGKPRWQGEDITGRTLLLHAEQGHGDTLQFVRYARLVARRGARVVLLVQPGLQRLLASMPEVAAVVGYGDPLPDFDLQCSLMSLPALFGTRIDTIPAGSPYLAADPALVASWRERLPPADGPRVGIVWTGKSRPDQPEADAIDQRRSTRLAAWTPLLETGGVSFISLQLGPSAAQLDDVPSGIRPFDPMPDVADFADTAALLMNIDLVVSVDTSVAHLAGALGRPTWVLSRHDACWRWLRDRSDSPWYPTMRLFRQPSPGGWAAVIEEVHAELAAALTRRLPGPAVTRKDASGRPDDPAADVERAMSLLRHGKFEEGWAAYERRLDLGGRQTLVSAASFAAHRHRLLRRGEALDGKSVALYTDQAFGDAIQFVRYLPLLAERGATVVLACPAALHRLLASVQGVRRVVSPPDGMAKDALDLSALPHDRHLPLASLPAFFGTTERTIPNEVPYMAPPPGLVEGWRARMALDGRIKVGLAWAGDPSPARPGSSAAGTDTLSALAGAGNAVFVNLRPGGDVAVAALVRRGMPIIDPMAGVADLADTAAIIRTLDLVIAGDGVVAHLAAALGKPVWLLLPFESGWRWMLDRPDSPWYPTMRLFRQPAPDAWQPVIDEIGAMLGTFR